MDQRLTGKYKVQVLDECGNLIYDQPEFKKNLILNNGLDKISTTYFSTLTQYSIIGTGSRANSISSGGSTIDQVGSTITLNGTGDITNFLSAITGYTNTLQVGDVIKYTTGSAGITEVTVVGSISNTSATVSPEVTITSDTFTIWKTSQTSLHGESKRGGAGVPGASYYTGVGNCGTTVNQNKIILKRSFHFPYETTTKTYYELGVGWTAVRDTDPGTFSRILLDSPISVSTGNLIRFVYQLEIDMYPSGSITASNVPVANWPISPATNTNVTESIQQYGIATVDTNGLPEYPFGISMEPAFVYNGYYGFVWISNTGSLTTMGSSVTKGSTYAITPLLGLSYVTGTYCRYKYGTFNPIQMNRTDIASFGISDGIPTTNTYAVILEQTQSKRNTEELTLMFKYSWGRTLDN